MTGDVSTLSVSELADFYQPLGQLWVRSNMVISLDGHFDDSQQSSEALSSDLDLRILLLLRAISDVIVVGGRTARKENYTPKPCRPEFSEVAKPQTHVAVITQSLDFEISNKLFHGSSKPILLTSDTAVEQATQQHLDDLQNLAIIRHTSEVTGTWAIKELRSLGMSQIVCEGGPFVQNLLRSAGVLNEMDVTISPMLMGRNTSGSAFGPTQSLMTLHSFAMGDNQVFARFLL